MMAEQLVREKKIPVLTVLKNGTILKNIFVVSSRDFSSPERNGNVVSDEEQILIVGRHPDCDILLTHRSISKYHLQIRSLPSRQKLFVTDLSSVDGTWVRDEKVEADACVEVEEGDVIRIGASTRLYRLHWIPLGNAYDLDNPFAVNEQEQDEENLESQALGDDGDGSSFPSEDEDITYINTMEFSLPLASPSALTLARHSVDTQSDEDFQTSSLEKPSKQHSCGFAEGLRDNECYLRGDGGDLLLDVMSESEMESSVPNEDEETSSLPLLRYFTETDKLQLREDVQASPELAISIPSSYKLSIGKKKMKWTVVLDTSSLLDKESRKPLHLLQGLKGTHLVVPGAVLRELNETKRTRSLLFRRRRRAEIASSALDWIEECKVNTKWWIQLQSLSEEIKVTAPTPPVTPQSNGSAFPFSLHWNNNYTPEIDSPTPEDQVVQCALLYQNRNTYEKLVLLSNDVTIKIKAMAKDVICETPHEFYESLKNPLSERFMWPESLPRGRTWSHADDVVWYNNRNCFPYMKKATFNGGENGATAAARGLKLILHHYGHIHR